MGERIARAFIDMETPRFEAYDERLPRPLCPEEGQPRGVRRRRAARHRTAAARPARERIVWMAARLRELESKYRSILFVCSLIDWPWIRDAYSRQARARRGSSRSSRRCRRSPVDPKTLIFLLGELPFLTGLYERGRRELTPDDNLSVDGVKEMVLHARDRLRTTLPNVAQRVTPQLLSVYFRYVRNLSLIDRRLTPDLYSLVVAAKQTAGDDFALARRRDGPGISLLRGIGRRRRFTTRDSGWASTRPTSPAGARRRMVSRLPGQALDLADLRAATPAARAAIASVWKQRWNPFGMCSWPPEDDRIESFQRHVRDQAKAILGADLARSEKFTTSVMDGVDIRETLRNWHTGDLYVKVLPPSRGSIEVVVFLFDVPADPQLYTNRTTWYAEHAEESTLAFFATDPMKNLVGPGIAQAEYGGACFLFPPRPIPDIWTDPRLDFADTLEERLLAGAFLHSRERHVAVVSPNRPRPRWRRLARRFGRKIVHLPLKRFSGQLVERLRQFHVLNGKAVRSYAADFIRDS